MSYHGKRSSNSSLPSVNPYSGLTNVWEFTMMYRMLHGEQQQMKKTPPIGFVFDAKNGSEQFTRIFTVEKANAENTKIIEIEIGKFSDKGGEVALRLMSLAPKLTNLREIVFSGNSEYDAKYFRIQKTMFDDFLSKIPTTPSIIFHNLPIEFYELRKDININELIVPRKIITLTPIVGKEVFIDCKASVYSTILSERVSDVIVEEGYIISIFGKTFNNCHV